MRVPPAAAWMMFLSGAAALGYEVVWMRMLTRAFGITVYAVSTLVAVYMGGLALGAWAASRLRGPRAWLRLYAWTEAAALACAAAATGAMRRLPALIAALGGAEPLPQFARAALVLPVLLPPTFLLGATLPILTRGRREAEAAGRLYGANTLGATAGLFLTAFGTLGAWGETAAVGFAAALNAAAAALAFASSRGEARAAAEKAPAAGGARFGRLGLWLFGLSGFCAMGYEIAWSRQLTFLFGNSTYAFSLLLIVYLAGVGLGSSAAASWGGGPEGSLERFALLEWLLGLCALFGLAVFGAFGLALDSPRYLYSPLQGRADFLLILAQAALMVLPAALAMGMLFPVAVRLASAGPREDGAAVGRLYAANTLGGILGSLATGYWLIGRWGAHASLLALVVLNFLIGAAALRARGARSLPGPRAAALALLAAALVGLVRGDPTLDILSRRLKREVRGPFRILFHDESAAAAITGVAVPGGKMLLINGITTAGTGLPGALMAVLPHLFLESPRSTLVICFGAGTTFRTSSILGGAVDAVELVGDVVRRMPEFYPDAEEFLSKPGNSVRVDDGRQYLLRSRRRFDSIIVDAAPPLFSSGAVNLYSRDFMELARGHLSPQGLFTLWVPLQSFEDDYWAILRSMADVFPHLAVWGAPPLPGILFFGSQAPFSWPRGVLARRIRERLRGPSMAGFTEARLLGSFQLNEAEIRAYVKDRPPVTDDFPTTEFPLMNFLRRLPLQASADFLRKARRPL